MSSTPIAVLIVEDKFLVRMSIVAELGDNGLQALEAANALEAISILETAPAAHVVFTDADMPGGVDGLELAKIVQQRFHNIKLVVTSGHRLVTERDLSVETRFIPKPYVPNRSSRRS